MIIRQSSICTYNIFLTTYLKAAEYFPVTLRQLSYALPFYSIEIWLKS